MVHKDIETVRNILDDFVAAVKETTEQLVEGIHTDVRASQKAANIDFVRREFAKQKLPTPLRETVERGYHLFTWGTLRFGGGIVLRVPEEEYLLQVEVTAYARNYEIGSREFKSVSTAVTNVKDWLHAMGGVANYDH